MRFNNLDLNLLLALDALIEEESVSAAAERMNLSQSAMSGALARLRVALGDDLLLQRGRRMVATPRAIELAAAVRDVLQRIESNVLGRPEFHPSTSNRTISIMASDYALSVGLAPALRTIGRLAPSLHFDLVPLGSDPAGMLDRGEIQLLVIPDIYAGPDHPRKVLFEDNYVCVACRDNPAMVETPDLDTFCSLPHVAVEFERQRGQSAFDHINTLTGNRLRRAITVTHYGTVPLLIAGTDRVGLMHARFAELYRNLLPLRVHPLPFSVPGIVEVVQWQRINAGDDGLMWIVDMIESEVQKLGMMARQPGPASKAEKEMS
jgi:LysR family nod box-dependent transcriptional activator